MAWLRNIRIRPTSRPSAIVDPLTPVLAQGLATARGARAADLRAHLGWADMLRSRDGAADTDPDAQFRRALADDPGNVYANAMRAHFLAQHNRGDEAMALFATAVASGRDREFVRQLQLGAWLWRGGYSVRALQTVNDMRKRGETLTGDQRSALWSPLYFANLISYEDDRTFLAALPGSEQLATYDWLFRSRATREKPRRGATSGRSCNCRRASASRRSAHSKRCAELVASRQGGRILDLTQRALAELKKKKAP
jgi:hypothetical protein